MNRLSMMEQVHLGGEDEEDIYGGFNDYNATLDTDVSIMIYSKTCLKQPLKNRQNKDLNDKW